MQSTGRHIRFFITLKSIIYANFLRKMSWEQESEGFDLRIPTQFGLGLTETPAIFNDLVIDCSLPIAGTNNQDLIWDADSQWRKDMQTLQVSSQQLELSCLEMTCPMRSEGGVL